MSHSPPDEQSCGGRQLAGHIGVTVARVGVGAAVLMALWWSLEIRR
jgi:hypothetical protein